MRHNLKTSHALYGAAVGYLRAETLNRLKKQSLPQTQSLQIKKNEKWISASGGHKKNPAVKLLLHSFHGEAIRRCLPKNGRRVNLKRNLFLKKAAAP
jgi:hypothetical protein